MIKFKKYRGLLALANAPGNGKSILDWHPFTGGDNLNKIINDYNTRCIQSYQKLGWLPEFIEALGEGINIMPYDLSTVHDLRTPDFANISIILIDLDANGKKTTEINQIRLRISKKNSTFLPQISRTPSMMSHISDFKGLPVFPSKPVIIVDQATFEKWLNPFCKAYQLAITSMPPLPRGAPVTIKAYAEALPEVAGKVRDAAIIKDLSKKETVTLARRAAMQEFALSQVEAQVRTRTRPSVFLEAIREPVVNIPFEPYLQTSAMQRVDLVELHLARPIRKLTTEQRNIVVGLGIKGKTFAAVHLDQPTIWNMAKSLEGVVEATKFSTKLPVGLMGKMGL